MLCVSVVFLVVCGLFTVNVDVNVCFAVVVCFSLCLVVLHDWVCCVCLSPALRTVECGTLCCVSVVPWLCVVKCRCVFCCGCGVFVVFGCSS